jgi:hypothetical protein
MPSESNTIDDFGKSITNDFNITVANLVVTQDALIEGDLTVNGAIIFDNLSINNLVADNATITDLTLENPLPTLSGGTGLATIGTAGQVLSVNSTGTGLVYTSNTEGAVTAVAASSPLSSSGGSTPTISIPLTTGTGSTVVLKNAPTLIGPVIVEGDINAENLTLENPLPTLIGGTGLATIGTAGQVLSVNSTGTGLVYTSNTAGSVTSVSASSPLSSSGGSTPTISIPLTTGTGSTVVLKNAPDLIGPVTVEGDINAENGSIGLVARHDVTEPSASISMNTFASKNSRIRTTNDVEFRIDNIGLGQRKKMKLMADSVTVTRQEGNEPADGFYVDLPTTIRNETFIRETYCSEMLNFPQVVSIPNENGIRMYTGDNQANARIEFGILSGEFYPATSSSFFKIADVSGSFNVTLGTGSVSYSLGTGNFSVSTVTLGNINLLCAGIGAVTIQTAGIGGISLACAGAGGISLAATSGLISLTSGTVMTLTATTSITHTAPTSIFNSFCVMNRTVNISGLLSCQGGASISGGTKFFGTAAFGGGITVTGTTKLTGPANVTGAFTVTGSSTVSGAGTFRGGLTIQGASTATGAVTVNGTTKFNGPSNITGAFTVTGNSTFTGNATIRGGLITQGRIQASGNFSFTGPVAISGNLAVFGIVSISRELKLFQGIAITGKTSAIGPVSIVGKTDITGTVGINGSTTIKGFTSITGGMTVSGAGTIQGKGTVRGGFEVNGGAKIFMGLDVNGTSKFTGQATVIGTLSVSGKSTLNGGISVTGAGSITGNFTVSGLGTINGITRCNAGLIITGATNATGLFNITGATKITGALNVTGSISSQGAFTLQGGGNITGALGVQGATSLTGPLLVTGPTTTSGLFTATGGAAITGLTFITGATQITGALNVSGSFSTQGVATFLSSTYMVNGIGVTGGVTINTVGQRCDITGGKVTIKSEVDAVNIIAPEGGFNIGSSFAGGVVGAVRIETQNGFTQFATGNIDIRTTTVSPYTGNGNISLNTLSAYSGNIFIAAKGVLAFGAANQGTGQNSAATELISIDTSLVSSGGYTLKFPANIGTLNSIFLSGGSSAPLSWLAPGVANTYLQSDGTSLSWVAASSFTDWANPGTIGSGTPNTGAFTTLSATANSSVFTSGVLNVTNTTTSGAAVARFMTPNLPSGVGTTLVLGKSATANEAIELSYVHNTALNSRSSTWQFFGGAGSNITLRPADITLNGATTVTSGVFRASGTLNIPQIADGVFIGIDGNFSGIQLNGVNGSYLDFSQSGVDFNARILCQNTTKTLLYHSDRHLFGNTAITINYFSINDGFAARVNGTCGVVSNLFVNSANTSSSTNLNPAVFVFSDGATLGNSYGMDLGYNATSARYRTRIFAPTTGAGADIALSTGQRGTGSNQSSYTDRLVVRGDTGNIEMSRTFITSDSSVFTLGVLNVTNTTTSGAAVARFMTPNLPSGVQTVLSLGRSSSTNDAAEFSYSPNTDTSLISTAWGFYGGAGAKITLRPSSINLNVATTITGNLNVSNGNIFTNQNIINGILIVTSGNLALTAASPGIILVRTGGGSGSVITLPTASTLISGYQYTINNNSNFNVIVNRHNSGLVGTIIPGNCAQITCIETTGANGQWDIHISGVDWANPGTIGSGTPNTGAFTTLSATANSSLPNSGVFNVTNTTTSGAAVVSFLTPNLPSGAGTTLVLGKSGTLNEAVDLSYVHNTTLNSRSSTWGFYGGAGSNITLRPADITLNGATAISGATTVSGLFRANGTIPSIPIGSGVFMGLDPINNFSGIQLNNIVGSYIDFSISGIDFNTRISSLNTGKTLDYYADIHSFNNSAATLTYFSINDGFAAKINGTCGVVSNLSVNSTNLSSQTTLNPAVFVFSDGPTLGNSYGMDLGFNATSNRYRTRIFAPTSGAGGDIALSTGQRGTGSNQSSYTDRLVVRGDTGNIEMSSRTFITANSSVFASGVLNVTNTTTSGAAAASFLTPNLPSGVGTILVLGKSTTTNEAAEIGYIHNTTLNSRASTWQFYGAAGSNITLRPADITLNGATTVNGNLTSSGSNTTFAGSVLSIVNSVTSTGNIVNFMTPNLLSGQTTIFSFGKSSSFNNAVQFNYSPNTDSSLITSAWGFYGADANIVIRPSTVTLVKNTTVSAAFTVTGTVANSPAGNGVHLGIAADGIYSVMQLNHTTGSYIDFGSNAVDFNARILCNNSNKNLAYTADSHTFNGPVTINQNFQASNLKNGSMMWFANANTTVGNNSWTSLSNLFVSRNGGSDGFITWIDQGTGFRNTSGRALRITASFGCQRTGSTFGLTAIRFFVNNNFSLGTNDVGATDAVTIACSTFLLVNETMTCQIYQNSGSNQSYLNIVVSINFDTFY